MGLAYQVLNSQRKIEHPFHSIVLQLTKIKGTSLKQYTFKVIAIGYSSTYCFVRKKTPQHNESQFKETGNLQNHILKLITTFI